MIVEIYAVDSSTMSHLTKNEVSPLPLRFRRDLRQVSGLRRDVAASSAQAGVRFQKGKTGELTPESRLSWREHLTPKTRKKRHRNQIVHESSIFNQIK